MLFEQTKDKLNVTTQRILPKRDNSLKQSPAISLQTQAS